MTRVDENTKIKFAIPKGRMYDGIVRLIGEAGIGLSVSARNYRPAITFPAFQVKILKPRAIVEMLDVGSRDLGFAGADWVAEDGADLVELIDTGLDRVRLVAAVPDALLIDGQLKRQNLVVASEYENLTKRWIKQRGLDATMIRSFGATEVLPPEDADCIVDNTATGSTLVANNLTIIDDLMESSTRLYASPKAMENASKRDQIEQFVTLVQSVIEARRRVLLDLNVDSESLQDVIDILPCMRVPTVAPTHNSGGFAIKVAVLRSELFDVISAIKSKGGTDIVVSKPTQIVP